MFGAKTYCAFGDYEYDAASRNLSLRFSGCSIAKAIGSLQERKVLQLTADELKYVNPLTASGTVAEVSVEAPRLKLRPIESRAVR